MLIPLISNENMSDTKLSIKLIKDEIKLAKHRKNKEHEMTFSSF